MTKKRTFFDDHDTEHDEDREDVERKTVRKKRAPAERKPSSPAKRTARARPVLRGKPIAPEEALEPAPLSKVRMREAIVRIQEPDKAPGERGPSNSAERGQRPEVEIAFVRSGDRTQAIERFGADGFRIKGTATGGAQVSVGVEGRIFGIRTVPGDGPEETADRLADRLQSAFAVSRPDPASAILREPPPER